MAEAGVEVGAHVGDLYLDALLDIGAGIHTTKEKLDKILEQEANYQRQGPVQLQLRGNSAGAATGNIGFGMGGPKRGRLWEIRRLTIGVVAGTALIFISSVAAAIDVVGMTLADTVDEAPSLPNNSFYSSGQIILRYPQELKIVILTPTANTQYTAGGSGWDLPDRALLGPVDR
jgi:hypothetical protein